MVTSKCSPFKNEKDLSEIPAEYRKRINFVAVKTFEEVLEVAIVDYDKGKKTRKTQSKKKNRNEMDGPIAAWSLAAYLTVPVRS